MIVDSQKKFERAIATAMSSESDIYDSMESYLRNAEYWMRSTLLGTPLYDSAGSLPEEMIRQAELIVSLRAFIEGVPFIDLVLTPTGFGIVSNTNLAPASKDRVDRLQKQGQHVLDDTIDTFIGMLVVSSARDKWAAGETFGVLTSSLIWTAEPLRLYAGRPSAHRSTLMELRPGIYKAEMIIAQFISRDYRNRLIQVLQNNSSTADDRMVIGTLYRIIGFFLQGMNRAAEKELGFLVDLMEENPEKFPEYMNSKEYQLKHTPPYENQKEDSVYFFG